MRMYALIATTLLAGAALAPLPLMAAPADTGSGAPAAQDDNNAGPGDSAAPDVSGSQNGNSQNNAASGLSTTTSAADQNAAAPSAADNDQQSQTAASNIMGDINIASIALMYGMNDDASAHIAAARQALGAMGSQTTPYSSSAPMTAARLEYKTPQGQSNYWIPVENDHFATADFNGAHLTSKNPDVDVTDAESVHYKLYLDSKMADQQLAQAQTAISENKDDMALVALQSVIKGAVSEIVVQQTPMQSANDNMMLARALVSDRDYPGASFALKHARAQLNRAEKDASANAGDADVKDLQAQIDSLQTTVDRKNPSIFKKAGWKIEAWVDDLKARI